MAQPRLGGQQRLLFDRRAAGGRRHQRQRRRPEPQPAAARRRTGDSKAREAARRHEESLAAVKAGIEAGSRTSLDGALAGRELFRAKRGLSQARYGYLLDALKGSNAPPALLRATTSPA